MKPTDIFLIIEGSLFIIIGFLGLFFRNFHCSKKLYKILIEKGMIKRHKISHCIHMTWIGGTCILAAFLSEEKKLMVCMPLLILAAISFMISNYRCFGKIAPWWSV